jgi:hypothetical protein
MPTALPAILLLLAACSDYSFESPNDALGDYPNGAGGSPDPSGDDGEEDGDDGGWWDEDDDADGIPNGEDSDDDGDGVEDTEDFDDADGDGIPDDQDSDDDNDGTDDWDDPDDDGDGDADEHDDDDDNDGVPEEEDGDDDNDGIPDVDDPDDDGDGTPDDTEDDLCFEPDSAWNLNPAAGLVVTQADLDLAATFEGSDAGYTSDLYLDQPAQVYVGTGHVSATGTSVALGTFPVGTELVFAITVQDTGDTFYSGPGSRNADGFNHAAVTYAGDCRWLVGFEDLYDGGDQDFNDIELTITGPLEMQLVQ